MDESELFSSPSKPPPTKQPNPDDRPKTPANQNAPFDAEEAREAALRRELEGVRNINEVIEGVLGTLERARGNMSTVSQTVTNASTLLNTWTRILSQTEHNQRLILNPNWKGATQDLEDIESENLHKQQEAERKAAEAERRQEEARRKAEEAERQRQAGPSTTTAAGRGTRGTRGRGRAAFTRGSTTSRGGTGGTTSSSSSFAADNSASSLHSARSGSKIGRGFGSTRGSRVARGSSAR